jgi:hypothetical protein
MQRTLMLAGLLAAIPVPQVDESASSILQALRLPALITVARQTGVPEETVRGLLDLFRRRGLPADEAVLVVQEELDAVQAGGPKDNFGAFVERQLEAGHRGRALAEAIRVDHRTRGIGRREGRQPGGRDSNRPGERRP